MFLLAIALSAGTALAGDTKLAEELFREGRDLLEAGDSAHACPKLLESYRQDPATGTLLALALCEEREGKLASAWATYNSVVGRAQREGRADRVEAARRRGDALEPRLSRLTVEVAPEIATWPGFAVSCDGAPLPKAAWGSALPLDPGAHHVVASALGRTPWQKTVVLSQEADRQLVRITADPSSFAPLPQFRTLQPSPAGPPLLRGSGASGKALRATAWITGTAGVVGAGVGAGFALRAASLDHRSRQDDHCNAAGCDAIGLRLNRDALSAGRVATGVFIAAGTLIAASVTALILGSHRHEKPAATLSVAPLLPISGGGVWLRGGF